MDFKFKVFIKRFGKYELAAGFNRIGDVMGFIKETFSWETEDAYIMASKQVFYPTVIDQRHDFDNDYCDVNWDGFDNYHE